MDYKGNGNESFFTKTTVPHKSALKPSSKTLEYHVLTEKERRAKEQATTTKLQKKEKRLMEELLTALDEAEHISHSTSKAATALSRTTKSKAATIVGETPEVGGLRQAYEKRRDNQPYILSLIRFIGSTSPERPEAIDFITSIAKDMELRAAALQDSLGTLQKTQVRFDPLKLKHRSHQLKDLSEQAFRMSVSMSLVIDGACIYILQEIEAHYKTARLTNPTWSNLYMELSSRVGKKTDESRIACLEELQLYLQTEPAQKSVHFGSKNVVLVLAKIAEQMSEISPPLSATPR